MGPLDAKTEVAGKRWATKHECEVLKGGVLGGATEGTFFHMKNQSSKG